MAREGHAVPAALRFGNFELRPAERRLLRDDAPVALGARAIDLLLALAREPGRLLSKQQLMDIVWPDVVVEEANLHVQMSALRKVLGADVISTVPGRGYQFVAAVEGLSAADDVLPGGVAPALPTLVGRDAELDTAQQALDRHALVTLTGTGGVGKTALARHLAHLRRTRHPHGVVWMELLDVTDAATLPGRLAAALDLKLREATPQALADAAAALDLLLVLDNGEHLGAGLAAVCDALLAGAPRLRLLVTSQAPLQLFGEHVLRLPGLAVPAPGCSPAEALQHGAVALFTACAQQADRRFVLDAETLPEVLAIAQGLDGSALGLQVAAALLARMPLAAVRQGLGQRLAWPALPVQADAAGRSRSLRAALEWSLGLLDPLPQELFRRLAAFSGPADAPLLQHALADEAMDAWTLIDALSVLVERSLVAATSDDPPRYQLLETPRTLAAERLALRGDAAHWRERVLRAVAVRVDQLVAQRWQQGGAIGAHARSVAALPDLTASFEWARAHDAQRAVHLGAYVPLAPLASAWRAHAAVMQGLAQTPGLPLRLQGRAWLGACVQLVHARPAEAQDMAERAAAAFAAAGDGLGEYCALCTLGDIVSTPPAMAQAALQRALALEDPAWGPAILLRRARAEGAAAGLQADWPTAITALRRAASLAQAANDPAPSVLISLANAELATGQAEAASRHLMAVIEQLRGGRHDIALYGYALPNLVAAALMRGQLAQARRTAAEGWPQAQRVGAEAWWADHLALLAALEQRPRTAASLLGLADAGYAVAQDKRQPLEAAHAERAAALAQAALGETACTALRAATAAALPEAAPGATGPAVAQVAAVRQAALASTDLPA